MPATALILYIYYPDGGLRGQAETQVKGELRSVVIKGGASTVRPKVAARGMPH
jgi:hypothetical protein